MDEVKWIKITTDMFDNRKIKHLRRLPEGNNIVLIWVMLLTMAGRCNAGGMILLTENIPYTVEMLADELDFDISTIQLALGALNQLNMIVSDNGRFAVAGWDEYQNIDKLNEIREKDRERKRRDKEKQKLLTSSDEGNEEFHGNSTEIPRKFHGSSTEIPCLDKDIDIDIEKEKYIDISKAHTSADEAPPLVSAPKEEHVNYQMIVNKFNEICKSLPKVKEISDPRKKALKRMKHDGINFDEYFQKIQDSDFLCQRSGGSWQANFDWIIQPKNIVKVQEGNYDNKDKPKQSQPNQQNPQPVNQPQKKPVCGYGDMHSFDSEDIEDVIIAQHKNRGITLTRDDVNF